MALPVLMADSVEPYLIPEKFAVRPNGVLAYADGDYRWDPPRYGFKRFWTITTKGSAIACEPREIDVERFDATPHDVPSYQEARYHKFGPDGHTHVYCDLSAVELVRAEYPRTTLGDEAFDDLRWHLAAWSWPLGTSQAGLAIAVRAVGGPEIGPARIIAHQITVPGHSYDVSAVFGDPGWTVAA